jgi:hypothetical protein
MSWTILKDEFNEHIWARLEKALREAADQGTLLFCAAPDAGGITDAQLGSYYPFGCSTKIFRIGAARADGHPCPWSSSATYLLLGHEVAEHIGINMKAGLPKTGSSVATALAAGLATLMIQCTDGSYQKSCRQENQ